MYHNHTNEFDEIASIQDSEIEDKRKVNESFAQAANEMLFDENNNVCLCFFCLYTLFVCMYVCMYVCFIFCVLCE